MKKIIATICFSFLVGLSISGVVFAADGTQSNTNQGTQSNTNSGTQQNTNTGGQNTGTTLPTNGVTSGNCQFDQNSSQLCNPTSLKVNNLQDIIFLVIKYLLGIIASVAVLVIVISGFRMVAGSGNSEAVGQAKKSIQWAVIGMLVAFLAYTIVTIVQNIVSNQK